MCFVQVVNMKLFLFQFAELAELAKQAEQFKIHNLYKKRKSTKNRLSNFGLIEKIMDLSRISLAVAQVLIFPKMQVEKNTIVKLRCT